MPGFKRVWLVLIALILIGGIVPVFHYWDSIGRVLSITPPEARELLATAGSSVVLIDVRAARSFNDRHLDGAENWPYEEIRALSRTDNLPERFKGKSLLVVCDSGVLSARAVQRLREQFRVDAFNVSGGIQAWIASADKSGGTEVLFRSGLGEPLAPPFKESPWYEQLALVGAIFVIKPIYMLLSLVLILALWRLKSPDVAALRWGLIFFLTSETLCAVDIVLFSHGSYLFEFFHMYGMVLSFAFVTYAVLEALDLRMISYSDPKKRCAALSLCRQCIKYGKAPCRLKWIFYFLIPALIIVTFIPLLANTHSVSYNTKIFHTFYNYSHPVVYQIFEIRYSPIYAIILFAASFVVLLFKKDNAVALAKVLLAAGMGPFAFALLRLIFFGLNHDNLVWFNFWEELTELIYMSGVGFILWIFRRGLFQAK